MSNTSGTFSSAEVGAGPGSLRLAPEIGEMVT